MTRQYNYIDSPKHARVREWFKAKLKLGTMKTIANEVGLSEKRIQQLCTQMRDDLIEEIAKEKRQLKQLPEQCSSHANP